MSELRDGGGLIATGVSSNARAQKSREQGFTFTITWNQESEYSEGFVQSYQADGFWREHATVLDFHRELLPTTCN